MVNKYQCNINFLNYMSLIECIPQTWKKALCSQNFKHSAISNLEDPHIKINTQYKNITQTKTRELYIKLVKNVETEPTCIKSWNQRLDMNLTTDDWTRIFTLPSRTLFDTRIIELKYKILHRCYATNSIISKWDDTKSGICEKCHQKANIMHNFVSCTETVLFWNDLQEQLLLHGILNDELLHAQDIILGNFKHARFESLNHVIMHAKYYMHMQCLHEKAP